MRAVIAERPTTCQICRDAIPAGERRLDDVIKLKPKSAESNPTYLRMHYHVGCYKAKLDDPEFYRPPQRRSGGGYPPLDISADDKKKRRGILTRMAELFRYYMPRLNLQTPPNELDWDDIQKFGNFITRFRQLTATLQELGGVPPKYQRYDIEALSQKLNGYTFSPVTVDELANAGQPHFHSTGTRGICLICGCGDGDLNEVCDDSKQLETVSD